MIRFKLTGRNNSDLMEGPLADWTVFVFSSELRAFPGTHSVNAAYRLRFNDTPIPSLSPWRCIARHGHKTKGSCWCHLWRRNDRYIHDLSLAWRHGSTSATFTTFISVSDTIRGYIPRMPWQFVARLGRSLLAGLPRETTAGIVVSNVCLPLLVWFGRCWVFGCELCVYDSACREHLPRP